MTLQGAEDAPWVVSEMINMMQYVLSHDGEFVRVDGSGYEYTGIFVVPDSA